jgi:hypothetical protein
MLLSARLPESSRELNSSKSILDWATAMRRKGLAKCVSFYMVISVLHICLRQKNTIDILGVFHGSLGIERYLL